MKYQPFEFGAFFHIYNRSNNHENLFREEENYTYFLRLGAKHIIAAADIYSYCLLPNHFHFVVRIKDFKDQPETIKEGKKGIHQGFSNWFNAYAKAYNRKYNRKGSLFQEHLKRELILDEIYLQNSIIYVNTNPTHHGISNYSDYEFSSYKAIISKKITLIKRLEVLEMFGGISNFKHILETKKDYIDLNLDT